MKFKIKSARLPFSVRNTLTLCLVLMVIGCDGLYQPISQPQPSSSDKNDTAGVSRLFAVNENQQICNPSASQDTVNFKGCMLFLNLEGTLTLNVPPEWETHYSLTADAHDRLTIVDTTNTVRWFLIKPNFLQQTSMQDPEWSRHPDYIAFLGDNDTASDGYIVRISDKKILKINNGLLQANSTPHLWLPDHFKGPSELLHDAVASPVSIAGASWDATRGMLDKETIKEYFGTDSVKFTFSKNKGSSGLTIYYIDYSLQNPHSIQIPRPQGRDGYDCESSLISPDGNWIVYNCKRGSLTTMERRPNRTGGWNREPAQFLSCIARNRGLCSKIYKKSPAMAPMAKRLSVALLRDPSGCRSMIPKACLRPCRFKGVLRGTAAI